MSDQQHYPHRWSPRTRAGWTWFIVTVPLLIALVAGLTWLGMADLTWCANGCYAD